MAENIELDDMVTEPDSQVPSQNIETAEGDAFRRGNV